jgi:hypothetical protein
LCENPALSRSDPPLRGRAVQARSVGLDSASARDLSSVALSVDSEHQVPVTTILCSPG